MAPLADAVSLVHRDQADADPSEQRRGAVQREALGSHLGSVDIKFLCAIGKCRLQS